MFSHKQNAFYFVGIPYNIHQFWSLFYKLLYVNFTMVKNSIVFEILL